METIYEWKRIGIRIDKKGGVVLSLQGGFAWDQDIIENAKLTRVGNHHYILEGDKQRWDFNAEGSIGECDSEYVESIEPRYTEKVKVGSFKALFGLEEPHVEKRVKSGWIKLKGTDKVKYDFINVPIVIISEE